MKGTLDVSPDAEALTQRVARWMTDLACAKDGAFTVALSGGSTPQTLYQTLARPPFLTSFPWDRAHWFWGDERFVPHSDAMSNYRMASEAMLSHAPVPLSQIHSMPTVGLTAEAAALQYEQELRAYYGAMSLLPSRPLFDLVLLGIGEDGHTASLVPGSPALKEREHWTAVTSMAGQTRVTLTYPALESCAHAAFLVTGASKRDILHRVRSGDGDLPAARIQPQGELRFFTDAAAAGCAA